MAHSWHSQPTRVVGASADESDSMNRRPIALAALPLLVLLAGCAPLPVVTPVPTTAAPSPTATSTTAPPVASALSADDIQNLQDIISSGNTQPLLGYLANPVTAVIAGSEFGGSHTPQEATDAVTDFLNTPDLPTVTWNFALDATTLAAYRAGFYGQYVPEGAIIGLASDGRVVSLIPSGTQIGTVFLAAQAEQLTE